MRYVAYFAVLSLGGCIFAQAGSFSLGLGVAPQRVTFSAGGSGVSFSGFAFGLLGRYAFTDRIAAGADIIYSTYRDKDEFNILGSRYKKVTTFRSIKVPLQFVYMLQPSNRFYVDLLGGLQPEIDLGYTTRITEDGETTTESGSGDGFFFGILLGAGGRFEVKDGLFLTGQLRFDYGRRDGGLVTSNVTTLGLLVGGYYRFGK